MKISIKFNFFQKAQNLQETPMKIYNFFSKKCQKKSSKSGQKTSKNPYFHKKISSFQDAVLSQALDLK
jgi:hypothetical protein